MLAGLSQGVGQMAFPVRTCALVGRFADPRIAESLGALLPHLRQRGVTVLVAEDAELDPAMDGGAAHARDGDPASAPTW